MRRLVVILAVISALFCLLPDPVAAQIGTNTWVATPAATLSTRDAMMGYPDEPFTAARVSVANTATTTAQVITALAGRKRVTFYVVSAGGANEQVWVNVGSPTAVVGTGIPITAPASSATNLVGKLVLDYDANMTMGYISAAATVVSVIQEGPRQKEIQRR